MYVYSCKNPVICIILDVGMEKRIGMECICKTHSCIPLYSVLPRIFLRRKALQHAPPPPHLLLTTSNKNFILKYFRCRDGKRTETRIGMEGICITHSCIPLYTVYIQHLMAHSGGMQEWVIQIPSIPILVSVLFPSLYLE